MASDGLEVAVTGPAGYSADAIKVFEQINGSLVGAAFLLVFVLLIFIYRSPILLWFPLLAVAFAEIATRGLGWMLTEAGVTVNGQSSSILSVLVLGAGTDYALLLVARYREELRLHESRTDAMTRALRSAGPAIFASGMTVIAALLTLSVAELNSTASLGPIGALGIAVAMLAMLTLLPAALVLAPRGVFWPRVPHVGDTGDDATHGRWRRTAERISLHPRRVWVGTAAVLLIMALGNLAYNDGLTTGNGFRDDVESVEGQELIDASFPGGANAPTEIVVPDPERAPAVAAAVARTEGVADVRVALRRPGGVLLNAVLEGDPYDKDTFALIPGIRRAAHEAGGTGTLVGGASAVEYDVREANKHDAKVIVPLTLLVVLIVLIILLRALVAPIILTLTVILSFAASLGVGFVVFDVVFGFPGSSPDLALFAFVFLVALGIDYNIFLMARVREESQRHGAREGMLRGLAVTGGVITSAGIVLAGTFLVLAVLPLVFLTEIGFVVAFGVLLDTLVVRSILVPALVFDIGPRIWWPSSLASADRPPRPAAAHRVRLEHRQVAVELPLGDLHPVVLPLLPLDLDVAVEDVLAEGAEHQLRLGRQLDRLAQRLGQLLDSQLLPLLRTDVVEVLLHRLGQLVALLDALEAGREQDREGQVGVAGRVGTAQLHARGLLLAGVVQGHPHQR